MAGIIADVTSEQCVSRKANELLDECRKYSYPHRAAYLEAMDAAYDPSTRRMKAKRAHYLAVMEWMSANWPELKDDFNFER